MTYNLRAILFLIYAIAVVRLIGQTSKIDSLRTLLNQQGLAQIDQIDLANQIAYSFYGVNTDSTLYYANEVLSMSTEIDYPDGRSSALRNVAIVLDQRSQYDSALTVYDSALSIAKATGNQWLQSEILSGMGVSYEHSARYQQAFQKYFESEQIKLAINDSMGLGFKIYNNIGKAYGDIGQYDKAMEYLHKSIAIKEKIGTETDLITTYINLGSVRWSLGDRRQALEHFDNVIRLSQQVGDQLRLATGLAYKGVILMELQRYEEANELLIESRDIFVRIGSKKGESDLTFRIGQLYYQRGDYTSALKLIEEAKSAMKGNKQYLASMHAIEALSFLALKRYAEAQSAADKAQEVAQTLGDRKELVNALETQLKIAKQRGMTSSAFKIQSELIQQKDSLLDEQKLKEIETLEMVHGVDQLKSDQLALRQEKELQELRYESELESQTFLLRGSVLVVSLLFVIAGILYINSIQKKKANRKLKEKNWLITQQKEKIAASAKHIKESHDMLEQLSQFKEGLTHMVAHDMKNQLNIIMGYSYGHDNSDMENINLAGRQILQLITNMLDVQKFESAEFKLDLSKHDIKETIRNSLQEVNLLADQKEIFIFSKCPSISWKYDPAIIQRVVTNLLTNAIKYGPENSQVKLLVEQNEQDLRISVSDQGPGIPQSDLTKIFDKFYQVQAKSSGQAPSTGLGLTFCKLAIEAHKGRIFATSQPNQETTFTIELRGDEVEQVRSIPEVAINQKEMITPIVTQLASLKVYQASKINALLDQLENQNALEGWTDRIRKAIFTGDQITYDNLIAQV